MKHECVISAKMKKLSVFVVLCVVFSESYAQNNGGCVIPDISELQWDLRYTNDPIKDTDTLRKVFVAESHIELASVVQNDYLDVEVDGSELIITTNDNFKNYEQNEASSSAEHTITVAIYLNCEVSGERSTLNFRQPVTDTNNNAPAFDSEDPYTYTLPMPLPPNLSISFYGPTITVTDIDISNTHIYFTIDTEDFTVETEGPVDSLGKEFRPIITATKALRYSENQVFTLTATDTGADPGPLSTTATINIVVDTENSYPDTPSFTKAYYQGSYDASADPHVNIEPVSISADYESYDSLEVYLEGDYSANFKVILEGRSVVLSLETELSTEDLESETAIILALYAKEPVEGLTTSTVLILKIPKEQYVEPPRFTKAYYNADYSINAESNGNIASDAITIDYDNYELVTLKLEGDYAAYFDVQRNEKSAVISVLENLPSDVLESNSQIILTIVASVEGSEYNGNAALIISLPENPEPPSYTKLYYSGSYKTGDDQDTLESESIQISEDYLEYDTVAVTLKDDGEYSSYFSVQRSEREITVSVTTNLPSEVVKERSHLVLTILAYPEKNENLIASTVLIISLPVVEDAAPPSFTKPNYDASYTITNNNEHTINVDDITISEDYADYELLSVSLEQEGFRDYFSVNRVGRLITLTLTNNLPEDILKSQSFIVLTIVASVENDSSLTGYTVVVISLPKEEESSTVAPSFTRPNYEASYTITNNGEHSISVDEITISEDYADYELLTVSLEQEGFRDYFSVNRAGRLITLTLTNNLPEDILKSQSFIVLTIIASVENDSSLNGYTVVVISLPKEEESSTVAPSFTKPNYEGSYTITNNDEHSISVNEITISEDYADYELLTVSLEQEGFRDYFSVNRAGRLITLTLTNNLSEDILKSQSFIVLTIVASVEDDSSLNGYTVVVISLPKEEESSTPEAPSFTKPYYDGSYTITDEGIHGINTEEISLSSDYQSVNVIVLEEDYRVYFSAEKNEEKVTISLLENLSESILQTQSFVVLTIAASTDANPDLVGYTVVVITLPETEGSTEIGSPTFTKSHYSGSYVVSDDSAAVNLEETITIADDYDYYELVDVELQEYQEYFSVKRNERTVDLEALAKLPEDVLSGKSIVLTIVASVKGNSNLVGYAVVIISLPESEDEPTTDVAPTFTKSYYNGSYSIIDDRPQLDVESISIVPDYNDLQLVSVDLQEEEYKPYFNVERNDASIELTLTEEVLPEEILENKFIAVTIVASVLGNSNLKGYTVVIISLPEKEESASLVPPSFTKPHYSGNYIITDDKHDISVEDISIEDYSSLGSINLGLQEDEYIEYFTVDLQERTVKLELLNPLTEDILKGNTIVLTIVASVAENNDLRGYAVVIISLPENEGEVVSPSFTKPYYNGTYTINTNDDELSVEDITIYDNGIESIGVAILEGDYSEYIDLEESDKLVYKLRLKENLPENLLENRSIIVLTIVASADGVNGYTVAVISIVDDKEASDSTIWFEEQVYRFSTNPDRIGTIGVVKAFSKNEESISYSIRDKSGAAIAFFDINEDTGIITNTETLLEGASYEVYAHAVGSESGEESTAEVIIVVNMRSEYSAVVRHVTEEEENTDIFVLSDAYRELGFWYEIYEQFPSDDNDYFKINSETGNLECLPIDREGSLISSMYLPQFTVVLRLYNNTENNRRKRSLRSEYPSEERTWVYLEDDIPNVADQTIVFVVVDDINDNAPEFINTKEAIGYPTKELALEILPSYVTVVEATDPDEGYNAAIYYSSTNEEFYVHPTSGVVYPTDELFDADDKKVTLTITATDRNGTAGGLSSSITTQVVLLDQDEISVLSVEGLGLEDVDTKLSELSSQLKLNVGYISASVVAASDVSRTVRASTNFYLRIVAYALDSNHEPITGDTLEDYIKDLELDDSWSIQTWESYTKDTYKTTNASSTGLLVAVIILAIILFIFLAAVAGAVYYFKYRRPNYATMIEDRDSPTDFKKEPRLEETTPSHFTGFAKNKTATTVIKASTVEEVVPTRRPTGHTLYVDGETGQTDEENKESSTETSTTLSNEPETATPRERKKSVAFNENVETLELEKEEIQSTDL